MSFNPRALQPSPDPGFIRELRKIDPDLRVVFGYERYLLNRWVIERRMPPERYFASYASVLESGEPRFIDQPIYDDNQPIFGDVEWDDNGPFRPILGYEIVGYRKFDLAPEWEWVMNVENEDHSFRPLDSRTLLAMRRAYAWDRFHSITRLKMEKQREMEEADKKATAARVDACMDEIAEHRREIWDLPFMGQVKTVMDGTEL